MWKAAMGGLVAAIFCAALWISLSNFVTERMGFMTILVGAVTGLAVRMLGESRSENFGALSTLLTFAASFTAEFFSGLIQAANAANRELFIFVQSLNLEKAGDVFRGNFILLDVLFYGLSLFGAYYIAIYNNSSKQIVREELNPKI